MQSRLIPATVPYRVTYPAEILSEPVVAWGSEGEPWVVDGKNLVAAHHISSNYVLERCTGSYTHLSDGQGWRWAYREGTGTAPVVRVKSVHHVALDDQGKICYLNTEHDGYTTHVKDHPGFLCLISPDVHEPQAYAERLLRQCVAREKKEP